MHVALAATCRIKFFYEPRILLICKRCNANTMDIDSQKSDEREVLSSIYSGDDHFQQIDDSTFQYRVEPNNDPRNPKRFMLQLHWTEMYPETVPDVNLDIFYNSHLHNTDKEEIKRRILEEASAWTGCAMTYTLFEFAKENADSLVSDSSVAESTRSQERAAAVEQKEIHRDIDVDCRPRGWNWVDVVKHLYQVPHEVKT